VRNHPVAISRLSMVEVGSALARRCREGDLDETARDRLMVALRQDEAAFRVVELTSEVVTEAHGLLQRHALRASDAIQLASLLVLRRALDERVSLLTFDGDLVAAAEAEAVLVMT
jgi:predicted nucleic acid-binding protein